MKLLPSIVGQDYAFAHGRLSVLMSHLMTHTEVDRFLGAPDYKTAKHMLDDLSFIAFSSGNESVDEVLAAALENARRESERMVPSRKKDLLKVLWIPFDISFLAFRLKEIHQLTSDVASYSVHVHTAYPKESLEALLRGEKPQDLPHSLIKTVHMLLSAKEASPQMIDHVLAAEEAHLKRELARRNGDALTLGFVAHTVDLMNVRMFQRSQNDEFPEEYIPGGLLPLATFTGDRVTFRRAIMKTPYGWKMFREELPFGSERLNRMAPAPEAWISLEEAVAETRLSDLRAMWNQTLGPGPVFAYINTIIDQVHLLRAILIGKKASFSPQDIRKILPPFVSASYYG